MLVFASFTTVRAVVDPSCGRKFLEEVFRKIGITELVDPHFALALDHFVVFFNLADWVIPTAVTDWTIFVAVTNINTLIAESHRVLKAKIY